MPRYRVTFQETCTYSGEVAVDEPLANGAESTDSEWFEDFDNQNADWSKQLLTECVDRELLEVTPLD